MERVRKIHIFEELPLLLGVQQILEETRFLDLLQYVLLLKICLKILEILYIVTSLAEICVSSERLDTAAHLLLALSVKILVPSWKLASCSHLLLSALRQTCES